MPNGWYNLPSHKASTVLITSITTVIITIPAFILTIIMTISITISIPLIIIIMITMIITIIPSPTAQRTIEVVPRPRPMRLPHPLHWQLLGGAHPAGLWLV